jgi:hypothetical protein
MEQDTSPDQMRKYHALLRSMAPVQRLLRAAALTRSVRRLAEAGIRHRHPHAPDAEVRARLAVRLYGREAARRILKAEPPADAV